VFWPEIIRYSHISDVFFFLGGRLLYKLLLNCKHWRELEQTWPSHVMKGLETWIFPSFWRSWEMQMDMPNYFATFSEKRVNLEEEVGYMTCVFISDTEIPVPFLRTSCSRRNPWRRTDVRVIHLSFEPIGVSYFLCNWMEEEGSYTSSPAPGLLDNISK
jgi:hypothetical protein